MATQPFGSLTTSYTVSVAGKNGDEVVTSYTPASAVYTLANQASTPTIGTPTTSTLPITINVNSNPAATTYAVYNFTDSNYLDANGASTSTAVYSTTSTLGSSFAATGLSPNTAYEFTVIARNEGGVDAATSTASTETYTNPTVPTTVVGTANGQTSLIVSWSANSNPAGTLYQLYNYTTDAAVGTTTSTSYTVTGLTAGTSYQFKVRAQYQSDDTTYTSYSDVSTAVSTAAVASTVSMNLGLAESATFKLSASGDTHTATVNSVVEGVSANLTIASTPVTQDFNLNEATNLTSLGITVTVTEAGSNYAVFTLSTYTAPSSGGGGGGVLSATKPTFSSFTINGGAKTTNSRIVTLNIKAQGAVLMVLSNSSDFDSYSYESYLENKVWTLTPGNGTKTVYIRLRSSSGGEIAINQSIIVDDKGVDTNTQTLPTTPTTPSSITPSTYTFTQFLTYGMRSNEVKQLQIRLQELGYLSKSIRSFHSCCCNQTSKRSQPPTTSWLCWTRNKSSVKQLYHYFRHHYYYPCYTSRHCSYQNFHPYLHLHPIPHLRYA
ncbi:MAG: Exoglucanase A [Candidatus Magasanikbacteria bacterium GW2011_GWC2_34_16]|uniref:Exoglucanase A n=1 Tax=Candidatus Magasanikbacteria bacterium GW2011_GWC2_34_16 TaxID=1619045 RepID=A0A0G0AQL5_9BACT|nr:MAG: Exoglucanase A [Candidatus Magasanikbacteria bacterium GW2011_GWC2_34_16]